MSTLRRFWPFNRNANNSDVVASEPAAPKVVEVTLNIDIAPNDPLLLYLQQATGPVDIEELALDSSALRELQASGVKLVVPLISQGELLGMINLGAWLSLRANSKLRQPNASGLPRNCVWRASSNRPCYPNHCPICQDRR